MCMRAANTVGSCAGWHVWLWMCTLFTVMVSGLPQDLSIALSERPQLLGSNAPTLVYTNVFVNGYGTPDTAKSTIFVDFYLYLIWRDDRLANRTLKYGFLTEADVKSQDVWLPRTDVYDPRRNIVRQSCS
jgi:hypothetical protein